MSDFDKEAERERLREKYETEADDRESTERMSELLLKGATMTNAHCGTCGDPIFRYDGEEFCPTCQEVVADADQTGAAHPENGDDEDVVAPSNAADATDEGVQQDERETPTQPGERGPADTQSEASTADNLPAETGERSPATPSEREQRPASPSPPARTETPSHERAAGGEVAEARESLERTLLRFSRRAEEAEDPRRARDNLEAASEAAEALAALSEIR